MMTTLTTVMWHRNRMCWQWRRVRTHIFSSYVGPMFNTVVGYCWPLKSNLAMIWRTESSLCSEFKLNWCCFDQHKHIQTHKWTTKKVFTSHQFFGLKKIITLSVNIEEDTHTWTTTRSLYTDRHKEGTDKTKRQKTKMATENIQTNILQPQQLSQCEVWQETQRRKIPTTIWCCFCSLKIANQSTFLLNSFACLSL